ncbi:MAG TPA: pyridoxal phosphate-dependent aminotransferase [Acidimicrobiia bacterium]|nr:pyridoxal phosphate-dependent aminotransferase [Acidimicrobiia bacterium]
MSRVSRRVGGIQESATMAISERAAQLKASGRPTISFGAGEPDFPTPAHIVEAAIAAARDPRYHHYTPNAGLPELREAVAVATLQHSGVATSGRQVLITNGGKQAVYLGLAALLDPGDEVLIPAPYWVTYPEATALSGGVPVPVVADETAGFKVTVDQLEAAATGRTKVLVFVSPSNPTGAVYSPAEVQAIGRWAGQRGIWVLTDEIYQQLVYGGIKAASIAAVPELEDRWLIVNGVAKTYAMTGWRLGWLVGPADVIKGASNHQSHMTSNVNNIAQRAALAGLTGPTEPIEEMRQAFDKRRHAMHGMLSKMAGVTCVEPEGAFYCYPGLQAHLPRFGTSMGIASYLLEEADVAVVPGEAFGTDGYARLSYALNDDDLEEGLDRMGQALERAQD